MEVAEVLNQVRNTCVSQAGGSLHRAVDRLARRVLPEATIIEEVEVHARREEQILRELEGVVRKEVILLIANTGRGPEIKRVLVGETTGCLGEMAK